MLVRHHLAAEYDLAHRFRRAVIQPVERADQTERGHRPDHHRNFVRAQIIDQLHRRGEKPLRHDHQRRAHAQRGIDILYRYIEIKRRLIGDDVLRRDTHDFGKAIDKVDHAAMPHRDALGRSGGAGGEIDVQRIGIDRAAARGGERRFVNFVRPQRVHRRNGSVRKDFLYGIRKRGIGNHNFRLQYGGNLFQTRARKFWI